MSGLWYVDLPLMLIGGGFCWYLGWRVGEIEGMQRMLDEMRRKPDA